MPPQNPSCTENKNTTAEEKCTSTSDLKKLVLQQPDDNVSDDEIEALEEEEDEKSISSCSAGSNSSCGSSYCSNCPHCLIQCKKSNDIIDKNVEEVFL